jgi:hypothetical protein
MDDAIASMEALLTAPRPSLKVRLAAIACRAHGIGLLAHLGRRVR